MECMRLEGIVAPGGEGGGVLCVFIGHGSCVAGHAQVIPYGSLRLELKESACCRVLNYSTVTL